MNTFTTESGEHIIVDFKEVQCSNGLLEGEAIHQLNEIDMECYPYSWSTAQKVGVGIGAAVALLAMIVVVIVTKRSREVKFLMYCYLRLDTVPKDDKDENIGNKEFDAFFCYR